VSPHDPQVMIAKTNGDDHQGYFSLVYRTVDGGTRWEVLKEGLPSVSSIAGAMGARDDTAVTRNPSEHPRFCSVRTRPALFFLWAFCLPHGGSRELMSRGVPMSRRFHTIAVVSALAAALAGCGTQPDASNVPPSSQSPTLSRDRSAAIARRRSEVCQEPPTQIVEIRGSDARWRDRLVEAVGCPNTLVQLGPTSICHSRIIRGRP
jgi:hypothetical protein